MPDSKIRALMNNMLEYIPTGLVVLKRISSNDFKVLYCNRNFTAILGAGGLPDTDLAGMKIGTEIPGRNLLEELTGLIGEESGSGVHKNHLNCNSFCRWLSTG